MATIGKTLFAHFGQVLHASAQYDQARTVFRRLKKRLEVSNPLFPLVGPNRHLFRLGPRTKTCVLRHPILLYFVSNVFFFQILFSFSTDKDRRTDMQPDQTKKHSAAPPGIEPKVLRILVARSNHWATKPQRELRVNFRLSPSCQLFFFFHYEVTRIARVYKHAATNDNSLDLDPFNRKLALVGIIPIKILFSFSTDKDRRTDMQPDQTKKHSAAPPGIEPKVLRVNSSRTLSPLSYEVTTGKTFTKLVWKKELTAWWKSKIHTQFPLWLRSLVVRACD